MKRAVIAMLALSVFAASAFASDVIEFPSSIGKVTFTHKAHQELLKDCQKCHASPAGGTIAGFDKDWAHKTCKGCHVEMKKGPVSCKECHKK
ncbi:cytochrome c7 [Pelobacter propionicus]|uniref:Cytochrome c3 n=1 Tax=Pelobacter propionicus (strain DSM 2379 / NBRC 103807 / OttBd1) TaxID=338966 RepID=A1AUT1_PELPD|nr:cytochrome c7 [Pelobacter propionicus]ABL01102.1 cytochrome c3 [Pelobacter propionicus DSM 2379]